MTTFVQKLSLFLMAAAAVLGCQGTGPQDGDTLHSDLNQDGAQPDGGQDTALDLLPSGPALRGVVVVEGEEGVNWPVSVTATAGDSVLTAAVDAQGLYSFEAIPQGTYTLTASGAGFYPAQVTADVQSEGESEAPQLLLKRWRLLQATTDLRIGTPLMDGAVIPYWVGLSQHGQQGELWLYLVDKDESVFLSESASIGTGSLLSFENGNIILFATDESKLNHLATMHIYSLQQQAEVASVPYVLTDQIPQCDWGDGVVLRVSDANRWVPTEKARLVWVDSNAGEVQEIWDGRWAAAFWTRLGKRICLKAAWPEADSDQALLCWNIVSKKLDVVQDNVCFVFDLMDSEGEPAGLLLAAANEGLCDSCVASYLAPDSAEPVPVDDAYSQGRVLESPDREVAAVFSGCGMFSDYQVCPEALHFIYMSPPGGVVTPTDSAIGCTAEWSADSRYLLFLRQTPQGATELVRFDRIDQSVIVLSGDANVQSFIIDPTVRRVAYIAWDESAPTQPQLWIADLGGGNARRLSDRHVLGLGSFSPDGEKLAWEYEEQVPTEQGVLLENRLALASLESSGFLSVEVGCRTGWAHCQWRPDSNQAACLCENSDPAITDGALTLFDLGSAESLPLCAKGPFPRLWFGPQHTLLTSCNGEGEQYPTFRWWDTAAGLSQAQSKTVLANIPKVYVTYQEGGLLAIISVFSEQESPQGSKLLDMLSGTLRKEYSGGLTLTAEGADNWQYYEEASNESIAQRALLMNSTLGQYLEMPSPSFVQPVIGGFKSLIWVSQYSEVQGARLAVFDTESGHSREVQSDSVGTLAASADSNWLAGSSFVDVSQEGTSTWWGMAVSPGHEPHYLAGNVLLPPMRLGWGAMVYGCASSPQGPLDGVCVARLAAPL